MTSRTFSGRLLISVDIGADSQNYGNCHVALQIGEMAFLFHPGFLAEKGIRGLFCVAKSGGVVGPRTDMGFIPDVDVLHHMYVYDDGRGTFQICIVDGLNPRRVFRTSWKDVAATTPFHVGVFRSGHPNVGMFDNLRVLQLPPNPTN